MRIISLLFLLLIIINVSNGQPNNGHQFIFGLQGYSKYCLVINSDSSFSYRNNFEWLHFHSEGRLTRISKNKYLFTSSILSLTNWPYKIKTLNIQDEKNSTQICVCNESKSFINNIKSFILRNDLDTIPISFDSIIDVVIEEPNNYRLVFINEADFSTTSPNRLIMTSNFSLNEAKGKRIIILTDINEDSFLYEPLNETFIIKNHKLRWNKKWYKEIQ